MLGLEIALLLSGVVLVAGRTLTVQKTSLSLTDADEEVLKGILSNFLDKSDVISASQFDDIVQGCSKGKCDFCVKALNHDACFVATLEKDSILLEVTLDKKQVAKMDIKVPNPPAVCKKSIPGIDFVKDVCVQVKDINIKEASGCVYISLKVGFKKISIKVACFKIPTVDSVMDESLKLEDEESRPYQDETILKFEPAGSSS